MTEPLHQLIYTSEIADDVPAGTVGDIVRHARLKNKRLGLTGLLIFDGETFCQYLEGPYEALSSVRDVIARDVRHLNYKEVHFGPSADLGRIFHNWSIAYADAAEDEMQALINAGTGLAFFAALTTILPSLDISPG